MTYADLYTYAGVVAVEEAGGPKISFRLGREDEDSGEASPKTDNLPNADVGSRVHTTEHVRAVFYRMGFSDQEVRMQTSLFCCVMQRFMFSSLSSLHTDRCASRSPCHGTLLPRPQWLLVRSDVTIFPFGQSISHHGCLLYLTLLQGSLD